MESSVGPSEPSVSEELGSGCWVGCGDDGSAGWKRHVVTSFLNRGVLEEATAYISYINLL